MRMRTNKKRRRKKRRTEVSEDVLGEDRTNTSDLSFEGLKKNADLVEVRFFQTSFIVTRAFLSE